MVVFPVKKCHFVNGCEGRVTNPEDLTKYYSTDMD